MTEYKFLIQLQADLAVDSEINKFINESTCLEMAEFIESMQDDLENYLQKRFASYKGKADCTVYVYPVEEGTKCYT